MKVHVFTAVCGSKRCNLQCPYCVSKMTPSAGVDGHVEDVNWRNFNIACQFARQSGVTTALITSKGEPLLALEVLGNYIQNCAAQGFPFVEIQTNGVALLEMGKADALKRLQYWREQGLTLVCLSVAHHTSKKNHEIVRPHGAMYSVWDIVDLLHEARLSVRINCTLTKTGYGDSPREIAEGIRQFIDWAHKHSVEQTTVREVEAPDATENEQVSQWVKENQFGYGMKAFGLEAILDAFKKMYNPTPLLTLPHGGMVFDVDGQNSAWSTCLTESTNPEDIRQLIFFPDGHLRYSWKHSGAIIL